MENKRKQQFETLVVIKEFKSQLFIIWYCFLSFLLLEHKKQIGLSKLIEGIKYAGLLQPCIDVSLKDTNALLLKKILSILRDTVFNIQKNFLRIFLENMDKSKLKFNLVSLVYPFYVS